MSMAANRPWQTGDISIAVTIVHHLATTHPTQALLTFSIFNLCCPCCLWHRQLQHESIVCILCIVWHGGCHYVKACGGAHGVDVQGTGQIAHAAAPGDGFITDSEIINFYKGKKFSTTRYTIEGECAAPCQWQCVWVTPAPPEAPGT